MIDVIDTININIFFILCLTVDSILAFTIGILLAEIDIRKQKQNRLVLPTSYY